MNEKNKNVEVESENWKSDDARQERRERLSQLNDNEGNKKPIKEKGNLGRVIAIVVALAILIGFAVWFAMSMGLRQRYTTAFSVLYDENATVEETAASEESTEETATAATSSETTEATTKELKGKVIENISVAEANIYLGLMSQQFIQGGAFSQTGQDMLSQPSQFTPDGTLRDDMLTTIESQALNGTYFYWKAKQQGMELDEQDEKNLENIIEQYRSIASQSQVTLNHYLSIMFGPGVNESEFRSFFEKNQLGNKYYNSVVDAFTYDQATMDAKYEENPDQYNVVDYRSYLFDGKAATDTDADAAVEPDLEKAKADAEAFAAKITDEESFKKEVNTLNIKDTTAQPNETEETDTSLTTGARQATLSLPLSTFLFSPERQANDIEVIEDTNGYRVVMFINKYKPENIGTYDSRHILFMVEEDNEEKSDEKMKAKAEEILAEFEAGDKSEESFAALATEYSEDPGSALNGGLTENIAPGQFVPEYEEFCLDPARKPGDVGIVKTTYGYHIIYFKDSVEQWYASVLQDLRFADEQAFMTEVQQKISIRREDGAKLFGRK